MNNSMYLWQMCGMVQYEPVTDLRNALSKYEQKGKKELEQFVKTEVEVLKQKWLEVEENYKRITELVMFLNWKIWQRDEKDCGCELEAMYDKLWRKYHSWCQSHFKGEASSYYFKTTD